MLPGRADSFETMLRSWKNVKLVPKIYGKIEDILIMQWFEGEPKWKLNEKQLKNVGKALREIHQNSKGFGKLKNKNFEFSNFLGWVKKERSEIKKDLKGKDLLLLGKWFNLIKDFKPKPVLVHGDFGLQHIIWKNNILVGMIDFENAQGAPAELDIANLQYIIDSYGGSFKRKEFESIIHGYGHKIDWELLYLLEVYLCLKNLNFLNKINPKVAKKNRITAIRLLE
jgi:aminoglycoside phosphotransferase (APT) family kinase protein